MMTPTRNNDEGHYMEGYRIVLKHSAIVVFNQDADLRYTWVDNPHPGFVADAVIGKTDAELLSPEDASRLTEIKRRVLNTGVAAREEVQTTINGEEFFYDLMVEPQRDEAGDVVGITCVSIDETQRKRVGDQIEEERTRLRTLVETAPIGIFVADAQGEVLIANEETRRILGLVHEPKMRLDGYERAATYLRPDGTTYEIQDLPLQRALYRGETVRAEEVFFDLGEGRTTTTIVDAAPSLLPDGRIAGAVAIVQDISPLEEVEKVRNQFLSMVTHELKTPLAAIKGAVLMALGSLDSLSGEETKDLLRVADEHSRHEPDPIWSA
jgi:PAS domain S-box-containing protein